mgnify:CR=1 FL=1
MDLKGRDFLKLLDFTPEEIEYLLDLAADLKDKKKKGIPVDTLRGKNVALIFEKTSTRTRCAFEVAAHDLGMGTTYLDPTGSQIGKKESIADTARVLAGMFEGLENRGDLLAQLFSDVRRRQMLFVHLVGNELVIYLRTVEQPRRIRLFDFSVCHLSY